MSTAADTDGRPYDALLIVSYGGPEGPDDVMPFLENATRGRGVPRARLEEVAEHYHHFGGVSPINAQNRALARAVESEFARRGRVLPVYLGNRNWNPLLSDTVAQIKESGVERALAFVTSAFGSYSGCRQYREDIARAVRDVGPGAPSIDKIRLFHNHPLFVASYAARLRETLDAGPPADRATTEVVFTAHSIPVSMAAVSDYEMQLRAAASEVARAVGVERWSLAFQSRSGPPSVPWLEPDICAHLERLQANGVTRVVAQPLGFVSDHIEVLYDLDVEANAAAATIGLRFDRAPTAGVDERFVAMVVDLVEERERGRRERPAVGVLGASPDLCAIDCCSLASAAAR
jgi:ferrochelatase